VSARGLDLSCCTSWSTPAGRRSGFSGGGWWRKRGGRGASRVQAGETNGGSEWLVGARADRVWRARTRAVVTGCGGDGGAAGRRRSVRDGMGGEGKAMGVVGAGLRRVTWLPIRPLPRPLGPKLKTTPGANIFGALGEIFIGVKSIVST
jgi:hypothetical protein